MTVPKTMDERRLRNLEIDVLDLLDRIESLEQLHSTEPSDTTKKYVWVLIRDYLSELDWSVLGIFDTQKLAEKYRTYHEGRYIEPLRIVPVILNQWRKLNDK
jgi:hypothetical protein